MSHTERLTTIIRELDEAVDMLDMAAVAESIDQLRQIRDEMLTDDDLSA